MADLDAALPFSLVKLFLIDAFQGDGGEFGGNRRNSEQEEVIDKKASRPFPHGKRMTVAVVNVTAHGRQVDLALLLAACVGYVFGVMENLDRDQLGEDSPPQMSRIETSQVRRRTALALAIAASTGCSP